MTRDIIRNRMLRVSLFRSVILIPLVAALLFAARHAYISNRQSDALEIFNRSIASGDSVPFSRLIDDFGPSQARLHFERAADTGLVEFDGNSRIAQIREDAFEYPDGTLDLLELHDFSDGCSTALHQPPIGTKITAIEFVGDGVDVTLYGDLQVDGAVISIPEDSPETYHLVWPEGAPPSIPPLSRSITTRRRP